MEFQKVTLSNNLPALLIPFESSDVASILFLVRAGARYEDKDTNGLSRFYANMCFKKTKTFFTRFALIEQIDKMGAYFNLEIDREYTAFYLKSPVSHFDEILNIMSEVMTSPTFDVNDVSQEKSFFKSEIDARRKDPASLTYDELNKALFGDHPLSFSGTGDGQAVDKFKLDTLHAFRQKHYNSSNSLVVVCGNVDGVQEKLEKAFSTYQEGEKANFQPFEYQEKEPEIKSIEQQLPQSYFALGFPAFPRPSDKKIPQVLLDAILSKTRSNRRLISISADERLALFVSSGIYMFSDIGLIAVQMRALPQKCQKAYERVVEEIGKIRSQPIDALELDRVKGYYKGNTILNTHDPVERSFFYGLQELLEGRVLGKQEFFQKIESITPQELQELSSTIFDEKRMHVVMLGPKV